MAKRWEQGAADGDSEHRFWRRPRGVSAWVSDLCNASFFSISNQHRLPWLQGRMREGAQARKRRGFQGELGWEMLLVRGLGPCKPHFLGIAFTRSMSRVGWGALCPQCFRGGQSEPPTLVASRPFIVHCLLLPPGRMLKTVAGAWCSGRGDEEEGGS